MDQEVSIDANSLLSELDKGLRSNKMGDECEAIVRFPWLFTRYPFPILINSACLKLAEVFRNGSNFSRLLILKVIQESEKHLDKILNVDEFVRRIFSVTYSNDPIARAITLRTLGSIAIIIAEKQSIHHCIRNSLESADENELNGAIEASAAFAKKSQNFALNIYPKILAMINENCTNSETKILLLSVLHHSHYNTVIADDVRERLLKLLNENILHEKFLCSILHTLTYISSKTLLRIPEQVKLLFEYFNFDERKEVKLSTLKELHLLAKYTHLWSKDNLQTLVNCIELCINNEYAANLLIGIIFILIELVKCPCLLINDTELSEQLESNVLKLCLKLIYNESNINLLTVCIELLTELSNHSEKIQSEITAVVKWFLSANKNFNEEILSKHSLKYKKICKSIVYLCNHNEHAATEFYPLLYETLFDSKITFTWIGYICETLCAIKQKHHQQYILNNESIAQKLTECLIKYSSDKCINEDILINLYSLYFQINSNPDIKRKFSSTLSKSNPSLLPLSIIEHLNEKTYWFYYRIIRQSMRYGHYNITSIICEKLINFSSSSENIHFWILSLFKMSKAESFLLNDLNDSNNKDAINDSKFEQKMVKAMSLYIEGLSALRAAVTPMNPFLFQCEYTKLRYKLLQTHISMRQACKLMRSSPAPAIATSAALSTRDDLLKCGQIVLQMRKVAKEFRSLAECFSLMYQTSFNADNETLVHIQLQQQSCIIFAEAIESLFLTNRLSTLFIEKDTKMENESNDGHQDCSINLVSIEHKSFMDLCSQISELIRSDFNTSISSSSSDINSKITVKQISTLLSISKQLLSIPLCVPRYFFQSIQNTCIKLALSPQPKTVNDIITSCNSNFALKVEGVIVNSQCKLEIRKVKKVLLTVTSCLISKASSINNDIICKSGGETNLHLSSLVEPHNDYFQMQFLLPLNVVGLHTITVEASIIDENEAQWKTGPTVSISTRVIEDPMNK